jgi:spermidine synthase
LLLAGLAFFVSGAAALVYQVAWQRLLALQTGVGAWSVAVIVASFMAGLGAGSHLGGILSTRLEPRRALLAFVGLELVIGVFGVASCGLYYDLLYLRAPSLFASPVLGGFVQFVSLLPPTLLMGMSLPFLVRGLLRDVGKAGRVVGFLYGINTLGAGVGALVAPWVLLRHLGVRGALVAAALANLVAALLALVLALDRRPALMAAEPVAGPPIEETRHPFGLWLWLYAFSGFCALSLEVLWFRIVDVAVKASAFTFGTVLAIYLFGWGAGALAGAARADRVRRPLLVFLILQSVLLVYAGAAALLLARTEVTAPVYDWFFGYWQGAEGYRLGMASDPEAFWRLYFLLPIFLYGLPTFLMGLSFPVLQRAVHDDPGAAGRKVGFLQAANIAGCVAGSLAVGLVGLNVLGTTGSLRLLLVGGFVFVLVGLRHMGRRPWLHAAALCLAILAWALPGGRDFWLRLHGRKPGPSLVREDATSVVAITPAEAGVWFVFVNGKSNSVMPYGGGEHTLLGAIPAVVHPAPRDIAIVGLGSGNTAWAASCRRETESVTVYEVAAPQVPLLREFDARERQPKLRQFLTDPRVRIEIADGRNALERSSRRYDLIEADALRPWTAGSGSLYSEEFFRRCAAKLKPGGVMCTWAPTPRVLETFVKVFPHVLDAGGMLVGGMEPLPVDVETWTARALSPEVTDYLGNHAARQVVRALRGSQPGRLAGYRPCGRTNHDLFPRDEFLTPD